MLLKCSPSTREPKNIFNVSFYISLRETLNETFTATWYGMVTLLTHCKSFSKEFKMIQDQLIIPY